MRGYARHPKGEKRRQGSADRSRVFGRRAQNRIPKLAFGSLPAREMRSSLVVGFQLRSKHLPSRIAGKAFQPYTTNECVYRESVT